MDRLVNALLIEDNDDHAHLITRYLLQNPGFPVRVNRKSSLKDGVLQLTKKNIDNIDVVLLDLSLPDSTGTDTFNSIKKVSENIPIVILSGYEDSELAQSFVRKGAEDYISKSKLNNGQLLKESIKYAIERNTIKNDLHKQSLLSRSLAVIGKLVEYRRDSAFLAEKATQIISEALDIHFFSGFEVNTRNFEPIFSGPENSVLFQDPFLPDMRYPFIPALLKKFKKSTGEENKVNPYFFETEVDLRKFKSHKKGSKSVIDIFKYGICLVTYSLSHKDKYSVIFFFHNRKNGFTKDEIDFLKSSIQIMNTILYSGNLELNLEHRVQELANANRRKDEFLATLSHELKNPLNVVVGCAEILKRGKSDSVTYKKALNELIKHAYLESRLISEMLDFSKIITGKFNISPKWFSVDDLIDTTLSSFNVSLEAKQIELKSISESDSLGRFYGDKSKIQQVLWNLLSNAIKFTPNGGKVIFQCSRQPNEIQFVVSDTGKGISKNHIGNIFEKFWQEDASSKKTYAGMGLGLSIVKQVVELHGGSVIAKSDGINKGSTFIVSLPIVGESLTRSQIKSVKKRSFKDEVINSNDKIEPLKKSCSLIGKQILAVDDDEASCLIIKTLLEDTGCTVTSFQDPSDALEILKSKKFDCLISDIGMPVMDGYDFLSNFRKFEEDQNLEKTPALALTAYSGKATLDRIKEAGFQKYQSKPLYRRVLINNICGLIYESLN